MLIIVFPILYLILAILAAVGVGVYALIDPANSEKMLQNPTYLSLLPYYQGAILVSVFLLIFLLVLAIFMPYFSGEFANAQKGKYLAKMGKKAMVKIIKVESLNIRNNYNPYVKVTVEIKPGIRADFTMTMSLVNPIRTGDMIEVLYDPADPTVVIPAA